MPDATSNSNDTEPKPKTDGDTPAEQEREDLEEAQKDAAEEREEEGGYQ